MAYNRPGVQVTQKQETVSPTLIAPDLPAVVLAPAYRVVEIAERDTDFTHDYSTVLTDTTTTVYLWSGVSFDIDYLDSITDTSNVYVDIVGTSASAIGSTLHIPPGHTSLSLSNGNELTINKTLLSGITSDADIWVSGIIKVGWRALDKVYANQMLAVESLSDVEGIYGKLIPENPLAFGLNIALSNAGTQSYGVSMSGVTSTDHGLALDTIAGQEVYAIAPAVNVSTAIAATYATHCTNRSTATEKAERIAFATISRTLDPDDKAGDATTISAANLSIGNKRFFAVHPHAAYYATRRHISTVFPAYLDAMNGSLGLNAILDEKVTTTAGISYYKGQEVTNAVWSGIQASQSYVNVLVPVPGAYFACAAAGMAAGFPPQQGHTNAPLAGGLNRVKYSNDYFTQSQLNTMAAGGTYIISQSTPVSAPACRHQLSTDMSNIETRELSITKVLDFVSKFVRNGLVSYIGKYNITEDFLKLMSMTLSGMRNYLVAKGHVQDLIIDSIEQSSSERDTLLVRLSVKVPYPVNYIKITLAF